MQTIGTLLAAIELEQTRLDPTQDAKWQPELAKLWLDWFAAAAMDAKAKQESRARNNYSPQMYSRTDVALAPDPERPQVLVGELPPTMDLFTNNGLHGVNIYDEYGERVPLSPSSPNAIRFTRAMLFSKPGYVRINQRLEVYGAPFLKKAEAVYIGSPLPKDGESYMDMPYPLPMELTGGVVAQVAKHLLAMELAPADLTNNAREN